MAIEGKKIFMTGGAGFIGSNLVKRLVDKNKIVLYDNLQRDAIAKTEYRGHGNLAIIKADILDFKKLQESVQGHDIVIHLAGIAGVDTVLKSPINTMKVNMLGTANICEAAKSLNRCERLIIFSTSEVFGPFAYKMSEGDSTSMGAVGEARWTYAVSKLAGEHLSHWYYKESNLPVVSLRPFNVYGPGQIGEGAIHHFIRRAIRNEDIEVYNGGEQIRAWCYIDDMVEGILLCLEKKEAIGHVFNIGNPRAAMTIYELAKTVIRICNSKSKIRLLNKPYADIELRIPSIEKAKDILNFEPKIELEEGVFLTAEWYRRDLKC